MDPNSTQPSTPSAQQTTSSEQGASYKKGSFLDRAIAYIIDSLILALINATISITASIVKINSLNLLNYLVILLYSIIFIGSNGSTLGMRLLKLKVVNENYQKIGYKMATIRALSSILSSLALSIGYYWMLIDKKKTNLA